MFDETRPDYRSASARRQPLGRPTRVVAVAAILLLGLAAAGCGSSSSSSSSSSTSSAVAALSRPQFLAQGNAICTQGNQRLRAAEQALGSHPTQAQITAFVTSTFVPSIQSQIDAIGALAAPPADQAAVKTMLDVARANLNRVKGNPALLLGKSAPFAEFAKLAHPYGLTACAAGS